MVLLLMAKYPKILIETWKKNTIIKDIKFDLDWLGHSVSVAFSTVLIHRYINRSVNRLLFHKQISTFDDVWTE